MEEEVEQHFHINDLEKWIELYGPRLFLYARQQSSSYADAQDLYQEAFIRVLEKVRTAGEAKIPPIGVFFVSIKHRAIDLYRSQASRSAREKKFDDKNGSEWFLSEMEQKERKDDLERAIQQLPSDQQEVLILKIWGELTFRKIGETLNISVNTAASRYRYALGELRSILSLQPL